MLLKESYRIYMILFRQAANCKYRSQLYSILNIWINSPKYLMHRIIISNWLILQLDKTHYSDVIMSAMASQITSFSIVYSTVCSDEDQRKHQSYASFSPVTGEFCPPRASNAEKVSIWWRHRATWKRFYGENLIILSIFVRFNSLVLRQSFDETTTS